MNLRSIRAFGLGVLCTTVIAGGGAFAATGGNFILGKKNTSGTTTVLQAKKGSALSLVSPAGAAPLTVSNSRKVAKLNADSLDGMDSSRFALRTARTGSFDASGGRFDLDENGYTDSLIAVATCPAGTQQTGGGFGDFTGDGFPLMSSALENGEGWIYVSFIGESSMDLGSDIFATVTCWSPTGSVPLSYRKAPGTSKPTTTADDLPAEVKELLARKVSAIKR